EPPAGSLTVTKVLQGDDHLRDDIEIRVRCDSGTNGAFDQTQTVPAGVEPVRPLFFAPIPAPTDCTVTEPVTGTNDAVDVTVIGETTVRLTPNSNDQVTLINNYIA